MDGDSIFTDKSNIDAVLIIAIVVPIVIVLLLFLATLWIISTRTRRKKNNSVPEGTLESSGNVEVSFHFSLGFSLPL